MNGYEYRKRPSWRRQALLNQRYWRNDDVEPVWRDAEPDNWQQLRDVAERHGLAEPMPVDKFMLARLYPRR